MDEIELLLVKSVDTLVIVELDPQVLVNTPSSHLVTFLQRYCGENLHRKCRDERERERAVDLSINIMSI